MAFTMTDSTAWLHTQLESWAGTTVDIDRGVNSTEDVSAIVGQTTYETDDGGGLWVNYHSRDYLIPAANYLINAVAVEPEPGDVITEDGVEYEVLGIGMAPCWSWWDKSKTIYRIHTKGI